MSVPPESAADRVDARIVNTAPASRRLLAPGGTLAGVSNYLHEKKRDIVIGCADPRGARQGHAAEHSRPPRLQPRSLETPPPLQFTVDGVQHLELLQRPEGGDEVVPVAVTGQALDDDRRVQPLHVVTDEPHIGVPVQHPYPARLIVVGQRRVTHDMEEVDLHPVHPEFVEDRSACQHLLPALTRQPQDDMGADPYLPCPALRYGMGKARIIVTAAYQAQGAIQMGLQPQLKPEIGPLRKSGKKVEGLRRQAVGTGADDESDHVPHRKGLVIN